MIDRKNTPVRLLITLPAVFEPCIRTSNRHKKKDYYVENDHNRLHSRTLPIHRHPLVFLGKDLTNTKTLNTVPYSKCMKGDEF